MCAIISNQTCYFCLTDYKQNHTFIEEDHEEYLEIRFSSESVEL